MNKILLKLFLNMLYISALTFGGGFVIVTFMKKKFVDELQWIQEDEMLDMVAIAQSSPGAIAVNAAILVGHKIDGFIGMAVAVIGTIIPPMVILTAVSFFYESFFRNIYISMILKGMQAGVVAVILDVVCELSGRVIKGKSYFNYAMMITVFMVTVFTEINVVYILLCAIVIGIVRAYVEGRRKC